MNLSRILSRMIFHFQKFFIKKISLFNHRVYMKMYLPLLKRNGMHINGTPRYIGANVIFDDFDKITLGDRIVVSDESHFLTHDYSITTALIAIGKQPNTDVALIRGINVGDNVFIGKKTIIMPNTTIGKNVIRGAGSVVRGKIPENSIVIGNPGEVISSLTDQAQKWEKYLDSDLMRVDIK